MTSTQHLSGRICGVVCKEHTLNGSLHQISSPRAPAICRAWCGVRAGALDEEAGGKATAEAALGVRRRVVELWKAPRE